MINYILGYIPDINFTEWRTTLMDKAFDPYETVLGTLFWVLMFTFIIGYVYMKQQSYVAAAIAALIFVAILGNYLVGMDTWSSIIQIFVAITLTGLIIYFISKRST